MQLTANMLHRDLWHNFLVFLVELELKKKNNFFLIEQLALYNWFPLNMMVKL